MELHLDEEKAEGVVNEAVEQIAYADRVILNKTDLVRLKWGLAGWVALPDAPLSVHASHPS